MSHSSSDYMSHTLPKKPTSGPTANQFQLPTARYRQSRKKERTTDKTPQTSSRNGKNVIKSRKKELRREREKQRKRVVQRKREGQREQINK
jgi:hypothetical protein